MAERGTMYATSLTETVESGSGYTEACQANISDLGAATSWPTWVMGNHQAYTAGTLDDPILSWDDTSTVPNAGKNLATTEYGPYAVCDATSDPLAVSASCYAGPKTRIKCNHVIAVDALIYESTDPDIVAASTGASTTTSTSYQDKVSTGSFTVTNAGDYLAVCSALLNMNNTSYQAWAKLDVDSGSATYNELYILPGATTQIFPWTCVAKITLSSGSHTLKIQYKTNNASGTALIRDAHIILIRLDRFKNVYYYEHGSGRGRQSITTDYSTYAAYLNAAPTITNSGNHLIVAGLTLDGTSGKTSYARLAQDPSGGTPTYQHDGYIVPNTSGILTTLGDARSPLVMMVQNLSSGASGTNTWEWQAARTSAPGSCGCANGAICVIELDQVPTEKTVFLGHLAGMSETVLSRTSQ